MAGIVGIGMIMSIFADERNSHSSVLWDVPPLLFSHASVPHMEPQSLVSVFAQWVFLDQI